MHPTLRIAILALALLLPWSSWAEATPLLDPCSGGDCIFIGVFSGSDLSPGPDKSLNIDAASGMDVDLIPVGSGNEFDAGDLGSTIGLFTVLDDGDTFSGTWSISSGTVDYVSVKAGSDYALYQYVPAASSGLWSTEELSVGKGNQPTLSNLTFWSKVPEPGASALLAFSAVAWTIVARRRSGRRLARTR